MQSHDDRSPGQSRDSLSLSEFNRLIQASFFAAAPEDGAAFVIAFDRTTAYHSPNFLWFRERYDRFVYVDRVVTSPLARGKGYAKGFTRTCLNARNRPATRASFTK